MHADLDELLATQHECIGIWQLVKHGWTEKQLEWRLRRSGLRPVYRMHGVWTSVRGPLSQVQRWSAATRTAPGTALGLTSGARFRGVMDDRYRELIINVDRRGKGGKRLHGDVLVRRTPRPALETVDGIPVVPVPRLLMDLAAILDERHLRRAVIEALRLDLTTIDDVRREVPYRPGAPKMRAVLDAVADLPIGRCRSNAEGTALVRRKEAGRTIPDVNVMVGGYEADLVDFERREITEIDGRRWHTDPELDAERDRNYRAAGFTVHRRPSDDAYDESAEW